jgi:hypothetical protein
MKRIIQIIICLLVALISWYIMLPPINLSSPLFWSFVFELTIIFTMVFGVGEVFDIHTGVNLRKLNLHVIPFLSL